MPFSNISSSYVFNSLSSMGVIQKGALDLGVVLGINSMVNSTSL